MAASVFNKLLFTAIVVATMASGGRGTKIHHVVGDEYGWRIPRGAASFYADWVSKRIFNVGDTLHFEFTPGTHDVVEVTKEEYDRCQFDGVRLDVKTTPTTFVLSEPGDHYYMCTLEGHCQFNMKLAVNVCPTPPTAAPAPSDAPPVDVGSE